MARTNKYETHVVPNLEKIEEWTRKGVPLDKIAEKLHVGKSNMRRYLREAGEGNELYKPLREAIMRARVVADDEVEAALFRSACGYRGVEIRHEQKLDARTGEIVELVSKIERDVPPDPRSIQFWLTNRRKDRWEYKPEGGGESSGSTGGVIMIPAVEAQKQEEGGENG